MSNRRTVTVVTVLLALVALTFSTAAIAKPAKVDVCHMKGNGDFVLINVSERALSAHIAHGDYEAVNGSCEATGDFLEFTYFFYTNYYFEYAELEWAVTGSSDPVTFYLEFDGGAGWEPISGVSPVFGFGEGTYVTTDYSFATQYRVVAVNDITGEVAISPVLYVIV